METRGVEMSLEDPDLCVDEDYVCYVYPNINDGDRLGQSADRPAAGARYFLSQSDCQFVRTSHYRPDILLHYL